MSKRPRTGTSLGALAILVAVISPAAASVRAGSAPTSTNLAGTFSIDSGRCQSSGAPDGSYLQILVQGVPVPNVSSPCTGEGWAYTPLTQGSAGLVTGGYQLEPVPTFSESGDSMASGIIRPVRFLADSIGLATTCANESTTPTPTGACAAGSGGSPPPSLTEVAPGTGTCPATAQADCLNGDLSSLNLTWAGFPIKSLVPTVLHDPTQLVTALQPTCANSSGCYNVGVADGSGSTSATCVARSDPGSCDLFGTIDPQTDVYALALSTGIALSVLPDAVLHLVLKGTFKPSATGNASPSGAPQGPVSVPPGTSGSGTSGAGAPAQPGPTSTGPATPGTAGSSQGNSPGAVQQLEGTLALSAASCTGKTPQGSFLTIAFSSTSEANPSSSCDGGTYTLLQPGTSGLGLGVFTPDPAPTFDANGNSLAGAVVTPTMLKGHQFGIGTSPDDVQDAPSGPATFPAPLAVVQGTNLAVDLRSLDVTYDGPPSTSCVQSSGVGCWQEGSRVATGTYDPSTGNVVLDWYSSQDFTGGSGEVDFHLSGHFSGSEAAADPAVLSQLAPTGYVVTGSSVDSESYAGSTGPPAASSVPPSASAPSPTSSTAPPKVTNPPKVVRIGESASREADHHASGDDLPLVIVGLGGLAALALMMAGRRSRRAQTPTRNEPK